MTSQKRTEVELEKAGASPKTADIISKKPLPVNQKNDNVFYGRQTRNGTGRTSFYQPCRFKRPISSVKTVGPKINEMYGRVPCPKNRSDILSHS